MKRALLVVLWLGMVWWASPLKAHDPDALDLDVAEVTVEADRPVAASSQQFIPDKEYLLQPQGRPAQVLRLIPGFIAVEHSGGAGKADQYFLRGFDADHGTDVAFFADGMPINLRSHAHGRLEAFLFVQNLFNTKWEQAVFAFESRFRNEATGVTGIHFVPGNPRMVMGGVAWYF